ncbi:GspH/FimT family pseudopilin [uncultured Desulfuromonas sp.]|uniref:GspH/FimT family pseudopilin n=1 Tax=uncultured Desulfuromonas sp. TaxID=181013 RepID=UPI002AAB40B8|nr:GspH/FimT family pseudopilin [uncultured Desulfuromonas sp.]
MKPWNEQSGFTMLELVIVFTIIAVVTALIAPNFAEYSRNARLRSDAQSIYSLIYKAKMLAVKQHQEVQIFFDTASTPQAIRLFSNPGSNGTWDNGGDDVAIDIYTISSGNNFGHGTATSAIGASFDTDNVTFNDNAFTFNSRGLSSGSGYGYIENSRGKTYAVGVLTTGFIMFRQWSGSDWE